ncbi:MAG TPA: hypothetical protein VGX03_35655 [Candidatus Binatia bacterium]|nr:hypothetical protein [Candidatus Binatia bacterium]
MKSFVVALVFSLRFISPAAATASPGHWTTGLSGNPIYALAVDPSNPEVVYAGGHGGIFKSTDGGITWTFFHVGSPDISMVHHLTIDPQNSVYLYASTASDFGGGRLFKSTDGGESWSLILKSAGPQILVIDPQHPTVLYGSVSGAGFIKSVDGGVNWTVIGLEPGVTSWNLDVSALVLDQTNPTTLYAGALDGGVLKSTDAGTTWVSILWAGDNQPVEDPRDLRIYSINAIAVAPTQPITLYVGTHGRGILKSTDGGMKWQKLDHGLLYVLALAVDPATPAVLYAATYDSVFMSADSGEHWQNLQFPSSTPPGINAITVNPIGTVLYVGTNNGVYVYRLGK